MNPQEFKNIRRSLVLTDKGAALCNKPLGDKVSQACLAKLIGIASDRTIRRFEDSNDNIGGLVTIIMYAIRDVPQFAAYLGVKYNG